MKLYNHIKNNKTAIVLLSLTTIFSSCSDYLDVDKDTDDPTIAPLNYLLTNIETSIGEIGDFNNGPGSVIATYTHQMTSREDQDQYSLKADNIPLNNDWNSIYLTLTDIQTLITQATESGDLTYVGIGQIQKAFVMAYAVDLWGDVPFTEATQLTTGIIAPKFDNQKEIYATVFKLIDEAKINIKSNAGTKKPGTDDLIYKGDLNKWIRFANTFKLKLYNQTRLTSDFDQAGFNALVAENNFFQGIGDDFQIDRFNVNSPTIERNRLFTESYESTQFGAYQSPWMYEILKGVNPNIHTGNPDPRMKYYYFNQTKAGATLPPDAISGNPNADYWDKETGFYTIRFGSTGPNRDKSQERSYTYPGIFPAGGRYDDGQGADVTTLSTRSGTGIAPHRILTYDEFLYIQAELIQVGKLPGNASTKLREAILASFIKVDQVVKGNQSLQTVPPLTTTAGTPAVTTGIAAVTTFIDKVITEYGAASANKQLEIIMTQKWVATFGDPTDQYTDYRRTGYPILADPNSTTKEYQLNNGDAFPLDDSQTVVSNPFQVSFYWPQPELNTNSSAPVQKNPATYKIFWDN
ncbi:SusD/RagB family nutrient-binding outer membrane lipoprotein [Flavobacterium pectinovorum]|uniref:SusD/RagB family nutrient-binding outer membrane lipoprotein n=1 Tax=Flavobacterium pectinovorum TaxID=29533 RepID=UPI001FACDC5D|nr:SusD/RagB family nutrient-binding outer membrane lipoprotein [Flavobacterium pectinovorum]MCI9843809.1 SusD/RagB family nutrient-binding outer membrane lipoprotein [Flavobacterium pectinovorum]